MPKFGHESLHKPIICRESLGMSLGPPPGSHSVQTFFLVRTYSNFIPWSNLVETYMVQSYLVEVFGHAGQNISRLVEVVQKRCICSRRKKYRCFMVAHLTQNMHKKELKIYKTLKICCNLLMKNYFFLKLKGFFVHISATKLIIFHCWTQ